LAEQLQPWAEKRHDHLCRCLCYLCHNKRKKFGPTIQERRAIQLDPTCEFKDMSIEPPEPETPGGQW